MVSRPVKPRAKRMALMVASVPEFTKRTSSMDGMSRVTRRASAVSTSVGAPKERPSAATACTAAITWGCAWPTIIGPQEPT
jgi:hypothetical protein